DLSHLPDAEQTIAIEAAAAALQASLDLTAGPLLKMALFDLGSSKPSRLLVIIHHLAVDGVSWRILMEDLWTACEQLGRGHPVELPPKTTSFRQWAIELSKHAQSVALRQEWPYWLALGSEHMPDLPRDYASTANRVEDVRAVPVALTAEQTAGLLQQVPKAYQ